MVREVLETFINNIEDFEDKDLPNYFMTVYINNIDSDINESENIYLALLGAETIPDEEEQDEIRFHLKYELGNAALATDILVLSKFDMLDYLETELEDLD